MLHSEALEQSCHWVGVVGLSAIHVHLKAGDSLVLGSARGIPSDKWRGHSLGSLGQ